MGGRGASTGISNKGKIYGTEYKSIPELNFGRVKFVQQIASGSTKAPMETMTKGRIYVTLSSKGEPANITFFVKGKRIRQIDLLPPAHDGMLPHTHRGYNHSEKGTRKPNKFEKKIIDEVQRAWNNYKRTT